MDFVDLAGLVGLGLLAGVVSALCGVGGGIVVVPLLVLWKGWDVKIATATSLAYIVPTAAWCAFRKPAGEVDWRVAAVLAVGGILGATLGVSFGQALPSVWVKRVFAVLLVVAAVELVRE